MSLLGFHFKDHGGQGGQADAKALTREPNFGIELIRPAVLGGIGIEDLSHFFDRGQRNAIFRVIFRGEVVDTGESLASSLAQIGDHAAICIRKIDPLIAGPVEIDLPKR